MDKEALLKLLDEELAFCKTEHGKTFTYPVDDGIPMRRYWDGRKVGFIMVKLYLTNDEEADHEAE